MWLGRVDEDGMRSLHGRIEAVTTNRLYATVDELAGYLPEQTGTADERRAEALALLGDDLRAAELRARHRQPDLFDEELAAAVEEIIAQTGGPVEESDIHPALRDLPPAVEVESAIFQAAVQRMFEHLDPAKLLPTAQLVVHIATESLEKGHGACRVPGIRPTTMGIAKDWLGHTPGQGAAGDRLERGPAAGRQLRGPRPATALPAPATTHNSFPWSTASTGLDLDHVQPFLPTQRGGPPGQTRIENLAAASRPEHRAVAHGGWQRRQPDPAVMLYRAPHGDIYLTNHSGTHDLGDGTFAHAIWKLAQPRRT